MYCDGESREVEGGGSHLSSSLYSILLLLLNGGELMRNINLKIHLTDELRYLHLHPVLVLDGVQK